jgi:Gluconate 2-dehydrogenase subunit 3
MQKAQELKPGGVSRRTALKAFGTGIGTVAALPWLSDEGLLAFARIQESNAPPQPKVFSPSQFATLELLVDAIIPTDDRSPGAKQARVADYIDLLVSEGDRRLSLEWLGGLAALDGEAAAQFRAPFVKLGPAQVDAIMQTISRNEKSPQTPLEAFFVMAKQATIRGYYTSKIGIHDELHYKGNVFLKEFVGCQTEDGKDCPHCGQKHT